MTTETKWLFKDKELSTVERWIYDKSTDGEWEEVLRCQNICISWSIQYMYSGNGFKQISGNALDLWKESLPVGDHGQLGLGELLEVHHDDLLEVRHPVVLEQLHLHLCEHGFQIL